MQLLPNSAFTLCSTALISTQDTDIDGTPVDMSGFDGVCFIVPIIASSDTTDSLLGIVGAESNSSAGTYVDYTTGSGCVKYISTGSGGGDDRLVILDIYKPHDRWVRPTIFGTSEVMHGGCIAIQYHSLAGPVAQSTATDKVAASASFVTPTTA